MRRTTRPIRHVVCVDNRGYLASLEKGKIYRVVRDAKGRRKGLVRVIDESGQGYLYPASRFSPVKLSRQAARALLEPKLMMQAMAMGSRPWTNSTIL
jgi:hypothetical protein